jgi:hypothetical protein
MTNAVKISALKHSDRHGAGVFGPVIRSAVGAVRESAGLVYNVAEFGLSLVLDTRKIAPAKIAAASTAQGNATPRRTPVPSANNVIPFPSARNVSRQRMSRG